MKTCKHCGKSFKDDAGLVQHERSKHKVVKKTFPIKAISIWGVIILVVLVAGYAIVQSANAPGEYDDFAQCLTDNGAKFYGAFWCGHCGDQKKMFGKSFSHVNYVECSTPDGRSQLQVCRDAGISGYPTWEFADGTQQSGKLSFQQLAQKTGCPAP